MLEIAWRIYVMNALIKLSINLIDRRERIIVLATSSLLIYFWLEYAYVHIKLNYYYI